MWTVVKPRVSTRSFVTSVVRWNIPGISRIGTQRGRGAPRSASRENRQGERGPYVAVTLTPRGGSGAHPTQPPPDRQLTQDGPQIRPGTHPQPYALWIQRP